MINLLEFSKNIQRAAGILEEIEKVKHTATSPTTALDGLPHARSYTSRVEAAAVKITALEEKYSALLEQIRQDKEELSGMIKTLGDIDDKAIMRLRFIGQYKPEVIAPAVGLCIRSVYSHLESGKKELEKLYPEQFTTGEKQPGKDL